jgi:lipoprotein-anchoring transpeptidase ErfK/SrfK
VLRTLAALCAAAGLACAAAPASTPTRAVPDRVSVAGIRVGGLTSEPVRSRLGAAFLRPLHLVYRGQTTSIDPARLGARVDVDAAVSSALSATPGSKIAAPVTYSHGKVAALVTRLAKRVDRHPVAARVIGATATGPTFAPSRAGVAVDTKSMQAAIARLLASGTRAPLELITDAVPAKKTIAAFGPAIVVTRAANTLRLYHGKKLVRTFRVATGQAIDPTPSGIWRIKDKQRDPWWFPPTYDAWAKGLKPVPPGPDNPLGTRWMGLNAPGVGIHGTDAPTSIGYSASHGCIRMQVPDAEWLFEHVRVGTPVVIL